MAKKNCIWNIITILKRGQSLSCGNITLFRKKTAKFIKIKSKLIKEREGHNQK